MLHWSPNDASAWVTALLDALSWGALALVLALLAVGLLRQFAVANAFWLKLDQLGIVPQWKFFAQAALDSDLSGLADFHFLVRVDDGSGGPGAWQQMPWRGDRTLLSALWNPHDRSHAAIEECIHVLALPASALDHIVPPTALAYLTLLRYSLDSVSLAADQSLQFAVVLSHGRAGRSLDLRFLSDWHIA